MDILVLDVRRLTGLSDYFVLVGASSGTHLNALEDQLVMGLRDKGLRIVRQEGQRSDFWRVLDYGGFIIHLMHRDTREFYGLERLWQEARHIPWSGPAVRRPAKVT